MKNKFLYGFTVITIAVLAAVNLQLNNSQTVKLSDLSLANVEAFASDNESNPWWLWLIQGTEQDEESVTEICSNGERMYYYIRCIAGSENCSPVNCTPVGQ
ncbi:MAG: NVEALA domain-containing protein [Tannerella sp.]|jgi:hypothetical protein|nr:NVEALA domain-containing protein [Tannerella sp.]